MACTDVVGQPKYMIEIASQLSLGFERILGTRKSNEPDITYAQILRPSSEGREARRAVTSHFDLRVS